LIWQKEITLPAYPRGFHLITQELQRHIDHRPRAGICSVFIKHTSAGLSINENADPDVRTDFETIFNRLVPEHMSGLQHTLEGPDDMPAHIKASMVGTSVQIPITDGRFNLGTWQGLYLCEFRNNGGARKLVVTIYS